jgi:hypothetical protein
MWDYGADESQIVTKLSGQLMVLKSSTRIWLLMPSSTGNSGTQKLPPPTTFLLASTGIPNFILTMEISI